MRPAHRVVCALVHGEPSTPDLEAAHSCDNPPCINPRHLSWLTRAQNIADSYARGRVAVNQHTKENTCQPKQ